MHFSRFDLEPMQIYVQKNIRKYLFKFGILFPKLFWPSVRKKCSSEWEKLLKFKAEDQEFANFLRLLEQSIRKVKDQNNFWSKMLFKLISEGFSDLINQNNYNSNWKKLLGFRNMQEKLENDFYEKFWLVLIHTSTDFNTFFKNQV